MVICYSSNEKTIHSPLPCEIYRGVTLSVLLTVISTALSIVPLEESGYPEWVRTNGRAHKKLTSSPKGPSNQDAFHSHVPHIRSPRHWRSSYFACQFQKITTGRHQIKMENIEWAATKINLSVKHRAGQMRAEQSIVTISKHKREGGKGGGGRGRQNEPSALWGHSNSRKKAPRTLQLQFTFIFSYVIETLSALLKWAGRYYSVQTLRLRGVNCHAHGTATRKCLVFKSHDLKPSFLPATLEMTSCVKELWKHRKKSTISVCNLI